MHQTVNTQILKPHRAVSIYEFGSRMYSPPRVGERLLLELINAKLLANELLVTACICNLIQQFLKC